MRNNQPITSREKTFPAQQKLISVTDLNGKIIDCNDAFAQISGFSKDELIGQPHNIVRHPDMPKDAFREMWATLKSGRSWMGLVKNRCKNGDYYWVDAFVTPVTSNGKVIGYESVRSRPRAEDVARATLVYTSILKKKTFSSSKQWRFDSALFIVTALGASMLWSFGMPGFAGLTCTVGALSYAAMMRSRYLRQYRKLKNMLEGEFSDGLSAKVYSDASGDAALIETALRSQRAHLNTMIELTDHAAHRVQQHSVHGGALTDRSLESMKQQQTEICQTATAMHEMTSTIADVSRHVSQTAEQASQAKTLTESGRQHAATTQCSIEKLRGSVVEIQSSVAALSQDASDIANAAQMIEKIADQTNLLALNAAIEAARAGEQGRGFAVVADEVRHLAKRTQESTKEIYAIIQKLTSNMTSTVNKAAQGVGDADDGLSHVRHSAEQLFAMAAAVENIAGMSFQMSAAVEQQVHVAEDINRQVVNISELSIQSTDVAAQSSAALKQLEVVSAELRELVHRFGHSST